MSKFGRLIMYREMRKLSLQTQSTHLRMVNPIKTNYHFKALPIYGTVTSITDQNGNELRRR
ncbi:MAG TPA: hypothetical protein VGK47_08075 [Nitrososphaeraceae archaeon]